MFDIILKYILIYTGPMAWCLYYKNIFYIFLCNRDIKTLDAAVFKMWLWSNNSRYQHLAFFPMPLCYFEFC